MAFAVTGVASAEYQVDKQIADIETTIQQHPDGIISIPVDFTATAPTYKKVSAGGASGSYSWTAFRPASSIRRNMLR